MSFMLRTAILLGLVLAFLNEGEFLFGCNDFSEDSLSLVNQNSGPRIQVVNVSSIEAKNPSLGTNNPFSASELRETVKDVYVWAWPMVYLSNVQKSLQLVSAPGISGGAPVAPINSLCMLTDIVDAEFTSAPCPNRDVVYGFGMMDLSNGPVVVQVPEFPQGHFWHYQVGDHRTESFAELGSMYQTSPGFYLIAGPNWNGELPEGFNRVFRSGTNLAFILPRILATHRNDTCRSSLLQLDAIDIYPLQRFTGRFKTHDWTKRKWYPAIGETSRKHCKLVRPAAFFDDLGKVLDTVPPQPGEERIYSSAQRILQQCEDDPTFADAVRRNAEEIEESEIVPLFDFRNVGEPLPGHWTSVANGANFGSDHRTRTAVAKSNIFVNKVDEAKYFYLEQAHDGKLLSGERQYEITFAANELPPHNGFWSLTLYDENHRLFSNPMQRHAIGSLDSELLHWNHDGSLTISIGAKPGDAETTNWIPAPVGPIVLYLRVYVPQQSVIRGEWSPPAAYEVEPKETVPTSKFAASAVFTGT